jgi:hypothetical protein
VDNCGLFFWLQDGDSPDVLERIGEVLGSDGTVVLRSAAAAAAIGHMCKRRMQS